MSHRRSSDHRGEQIEQVFPVAHAPWVPPIGMRVQLKHPRFPNNYGKWAIVTKHRGLGMVKVRLEETGVEICNEVRYIHRADIHGPMTGVIGE